MSRAQKNRKKRIRRNKKHLDRIAHKKLAQYVYKCESKNPAYYDVIILSYKIKIKNHKRYFSTFKAKCVPNQKYINLMKQLMDSCKNITVEIPRSMFDE